MNTDYSTKTEKRYFTIDLMFILFSLSFIGLVFFLITAVSYIVKDINYTILLKKLEADERKKIIEKENLSLTDYEDSEEESFDQDENLVKPIIEQTRVEGEKMIDENLYYDLSEPPMRLKRQNIDLNKNKKKNGKFVANSVSLKTIDEEMKDLEIMKQKQQARREYLEEGIKFFKEALDFRTELKEKLGVNSKDNKEFEALIENNEKISNELKAQIEKTETEIAEADKLIDKLSKVLILLKYKNYIYSADTQQKRKIFLKKFSNFSSMSKDEKKDYLESENVEMFDFIYSTMGIEEKESSMAGANIIPRLEDLEKHLTYVKKLREPNSNVTEGGVDYNKPVHTTLFTLSSLFPIIWENEKDKCFGLHFSMIEEFEKNFPVVYEMFISKFQEILVLFINIFNLISEQDILIDNVYKTTPLKRAIILLKHLKLTDEEETVKKLLEKIEKQILEKIE